MASKVGLPFHLRHFAPSRDRSIGDLPLLPSLSSLLRLEGMGNEAFAIHSSAVLFPDIEEREI